MFDEQIAVSVARLLVLMSTQPNQRPQPRESDLKGEFSVWFDGGAAKHDTGLSVYRFLDGHAAVTTSSPGFATLIRLHDGKLIQVQEADRRSLHPLALLGLEPEST
jgi:hypothetical protein